MSNNLKISVIGGGPAGLYLSILVKKAIPNCSIDIYERNAENQSFGFGVVFLDETLNEFLSRDTKSYELIAKNFSYWDNISIVNEKQKVTIKGNGFCGCSRKTLLALLTQRCREESINMHFNTFIENINQFADSDLIIGADGINSLIRSANEKDFGTEVKLMSNKFVWLGSTKPLDAFTYFFKQTEYGTFVAHTYQYEQGMSTWIIETENSTWEKAGFETENEQDTIQKIEKIFKTELDGHKLISNKSIWRNFPLVVNKNWYKDKVILIGDAVATAHFSIGSGTKLAMEEAIALADAIIKECQNNENKKINASKIYQTYETTFRNKVEKIQHAANVSLAWFQKLNLNAKQDFITFAFSLMTRSKKVTYENLNLRDKDFAQIVVKNFNIIHNKKNSPIQSPAFVPFKIKNITLNNRIVMSAMGQYCAKNGLIDDWHFVHYGSRAVGGVGLIITEMTAISADARITNTDAGIWTDAQAKAWKKIVEFVHKNSNSKIAMQLGHAGPKASCEWNKNGVLVPNKSKKWKASAASPLKFDNDFQIPQTLTENNMKSIIKQFVDASKRADKAGFDMIEIQACHGMLFTSFLSPLTNQRKDKYGGNIKNRLAFPLMVLTAIKKGLPKKPLSVRISASDWCEGGINEKDIIETAKAFKKIGIDIINVSSAGTIKTQKPIQGRMWQVPFSDFIKNTVDIPTITTGQIENIDHANTILLSGRADLVAFGRLLLLDAYFVRNAQAYEQETLNLNIPPQYTKAKELFYDIVAKKKNENEHMKHLLKPKGH